MTQNNNTRHGCDICGNEFDIDEPTHEAKVVGELLIMCSKLAKSGHDLALAVEREETAHKAFTNAVDTRNKVQKEYHRIKNQIDKMAGLWN